MMTTGRAMVSAGLLLSRQGPCGLPAICAAKSRPTPRRRSSAKRVRPRFHCFQAIARRRRLSPLVKCAQHRGGLAEAEVAAPSNKIDGQLLDDLPEARPARAPRQFPDSALKRQAPAAQCAAAAASRSVKLKPRNLRTLGLATALLALLTLSLRRLARNCSMLAITRSPAR